MSNKSGIFIFTKDRPGRLGSTLEYIKEVNENIFIIDDSISNENQLANQKQLDTNKHTYLGKNEFVSFLNHYKIDILKFSFLLRQLGNYEWNLGYARNFALLFAKAKQFKSVLFMDDDIEVLNLSVIYDLFKFKNNYAFVGAHISGLVDDSILGHIATDLGIFNERMISGGFMVFNPTEIDHFFLNNYNEDWIWLFLQLQGKQYLQTGEVFQVLTNPLENYKTKVMFQEYGEIVLDGILELYPGKNYEELISESFWAKMLTERKEYLTGLKEKAKQDNKQEYLPIIQHVKSNSNNYKAGMFKLLFEEYFSNRRIFNTFFNSLN